MALRKAKSPATPKAPAPKTTTTPRAPRPAAQPAGGADPNRLLREAAWSRMFGRTEAKNPFTR
jgi:hypothetical protein